MAMVAGACSVDLGKLRTTVSPVRDGDTGFPGVPDVAGDGSVAADDAEDAIVGDSMLGSPELPVVDAVAVPGGTKDAPESVSTKDATVPEDLLDSSALAADENASDAPAGIGGGSGGGHGGTGGVNANGDGGGGSGGTGSTEADGGGSGGTAGVVDADASGGGADAGMDSGGGIDCGYDGTGGADGLGGTGGAGVDPALVLWYKFDESSGTSAADSSLSGGGIRDGTLGTAGTGGGASFSTDSQVGTHALRLVTSSRGSTPAGGYVTLPAPESLAPDALTIAVWIKLAAATSAENWERIFDFGSGSGANAYFYLTARASDAPNTPLRFGISNSGHTTAAEQRLESPAGLAANGWHHLAIVLPTGATYTGALYMDGVVVATNPAMTLHLSDVGTTTLNWLGRSPFTADPFFNGSLDDLRIYERALSASEISALFMLR